jgi:hypothetical protein
VRETVAHRRVHGQAHLLLVYFVRTRARDRDDAQRQAGGGGLGLQHVATHGVHRDAIDLAVERRQQRRYRAGMRLIEHVQRPGAVLAAAPRQKNLHLKASG